MVLQVHVGTPSIFAEERALIAADRGGLQGALVDGLLSDVRRFVRAAPGEDGRLGLRRWEVYQSASRALEVLTREAFI